MFYNIFQGYEILPPPLDVTISAVISFESIICFYNKAQDCGEVDLQSRNPGFESQLHLNLNFNFIACQRITIKGKIG